MQDTGSVLNIQEIAHTFLVKKKKNNNNNNNNNN